MTDQLLTAVLDRLESLERKIDAVQMTPRPEWVTIREYAKMIGKSRRTVLRRIKSGELKARPIGGERMVKVGE